MIPTENRRILIVDDEPEIREGYRRFLTPERLERISSTRLLETEKQNETPDEIAARQTLPPVDSFELSWAVSGEEALALVQSEATLGRRFAGAFVDVRMPGKIDGLQFIQKAWEIDSDLLMVVVTAYQDRSVDEIMRLFGQGLQDQWDYLNKPFTGGEIVQKARQIVSLWNRRMRERLYLATIKEQQERLVAQEQIAAVGRLAHSIGHDLGNILQQILTKLECESPTAEMIEAVELGATICQDLLTFARRTREAVAPTDVVLQAPIQKALRLLRHELAKKDIAVALSLDEGIKLQAHESRLVQVFVNLMTNALYAMKTGGKLRVTLSREAGIAVAEIEDNGTGIPPLIVGRVFEPLFTTKGESGSGLGLAVCRNIVESYNGRISIASTQGKGTTVRIEFTAAKAIAPLPPDPSAF